MLSKGKELPVTITASVIENASHNVFLDFSTKNRIFVFIDYALSGVLRGKQIYSFMMMLCVNKGIGISRETFETALECTYDSLRQYPARFGRLFPPETGLSDIIVPARPSGYRMNSEKYVIRIVWSESDIEAEVNKMREKGCRTQ